MAQVDIGGESYDSFTSVEEADLFLGADIVRSIGWALVPNEDAKGRALASATRLLLQRVLWASGPPLIADAPLIVREVTAMLAADLIANPKLFANPSGASNVKSAKAGSASVEFFSPVGSDGPTLPMDLWAILLNAGLLGVADDLDGMAGAEAFGVMGHCRPLLGRYSGEYERAALDHD